LVSLIAMILTRSFTKLLASVQRAVLNATNFMRFCMEFMLTISLTLQ